MPQRTKPPFPGPSPEDKIPWPPKVDDWTRVNAQIEEARTRADLKVADTVVIPSRRPKEAVVSWIARCSQAMIEAALKVADRDDADLFVVKTDSGQWILQHRKTGQQVLLRSTQVPSRD